MIDKKQPNWIIFSKPVAYFVTRVDKMWTVNVDISVKKTIAEI